MDDTSSDLPNMTVDSSPSQLSFEDSFVLDWESYIRLKVTFPDHDTAADHSALLQDVSKEFEEFWRGKFYFFPSKIWICGVWLMEDRFRSWTWGGRRWRWRWREDVADGSC